MYDSNLDIKKEFLKGCKIFKIIYQDKNKKKFQDIN